MSSAISGLLGAIVGGLAAIGGAWLQARNAARMQQEEAARQEERRHKESIALLQERRQHLARRYLYQLGDAVNSFLYRIDNWAHRGGPKYSEGLHPGYWEITSLYVIGRALAAERILALEGIYIELQALSLNEDANLPQRAVEEAVRKAFRHVFYYHRLALAEAVLDRSSGEFRLLTYSEFLRRYEDPEWNLKLLLEPVRQAFDTIDKEPTRLEGLGQSLRSLSECIEELTASHNANSVEPLSP